MKYLSFLCLILHFQVLSAANIESAGSGNWNLGTTWVGGMVPVAGDNVVIKAGHTVTFSDARSCTALTVEGTLNANSGGNLAQSGITTISGTLNLQGGVLNFTQVINLNGTCNSGGGSYVFDSGGGFSGNGILALTGSANFTFNVGSVLTTNLSMSLNTMLIDNVGITPTSFTFNQGTYQGTGSPAFGSLSFTNASFSGSGTMSISGTTNTSGGALTLGGSKVLQIGGSTNFDNCTFTLNSSSKITISSGGSFVYNSGTNRSITGTTSLGLEVESGGIFTKAGASIFTIQVPFTATNGSLNIDGGTLTIGGTSTSITGGTAIINSGILQFSGASATISGSTLSGAGTLVTSGGTTNYNSGSIAVTGGFNLSGGMVNLNCPLTGSPPAAVAVGTLNDNTGATLGAVTLSSGTYGGTGSPSFASLAWSSGTLTGSGIVTVAGSFTASGNVTRPMSGSKEIHIGGAANFTASAGIQMSGTAKVVVTSTGSFGSDGGTVSGSTTNTFEVQAGGNLAKTGATTLTFSVPFLLSSGTISVDGGILSIAGSSLTHTFTNGTVAVSNGCSIAFSNSGTSNINGTAFSGAGTFAQSAGTVNFASASLSCKLSMSTSPTFNDNVGLTPGEVTFTAGTYQGTGSPTFANGFTWSSGTLTGSGIVTVTGSLVASGNFSRILSGNKELHIAGATSFTASAGIQMAGTAKVVVTSTGSFGSDGGTVSGSATNTFEVQAGGNLAKTGATTLTFSVPFLLSSGAISVDGGILSIAGSGLTHTFTNGTAAISNGCSIAFSNSGTSNINGTAFSGAGTFAHSAGTVNFASGSLSCKLSMSTSPTFNDNVGLTPGEVTISNGTYQGTGSPTFANGFTWSGGTLRGSGTATASGTMAISNAVSIADSKELLIGGTADYSYGDINMTGTAKISVLSGGALTCSAPSSNLSVNGSSSNLFEVQSGGSFMKSGGSSTLSVRVPFNFNSGTMTINNGHFSLSGSSLTHTFSNGTVAVNGTSSFSFVNISGVNTTTVTGTAISGTGTVSVSSTINFETGSSVSSKIGVFTAGILNDNVGLTPGEVTISNGTYQGNGSPTFANGLTWSGGTLRGSGTATASGTMAISNGVSINDSKELLIGGAADYSSGDITLFGTAKIRVLNGGTLTCSAPSSNLSVNGSSSNLFEVQSGGSFMKSGGSSTLSVRVPFNFNSGTMTINNGHFSLSGSSLTHTFTNGTVAVNGTSSLSFLHISGANITTVTGTAISGTGTVSVSSTINFETGSSVSSKIGVYSSGILNDNVGLTPGEVTISSGTYQGSGSPTFANGFSWSGGILQGSGIVNLTGTLTAVSSTDFLAGSKELRISGTASFSNSAGLTMSGTTKTVVLSGGTYSYSGVSSTGIFGTSNLFEVQSGGSLTKSGGGTFTVGALFTNEGNVTVSAGTLAISQSGTYSGTFEVELGATLNFSNSIANSTFSGNTLTNNGTVSVFTGRSLIFGGTAQQTLAGNGNSITNLTFNNSNDVNITGSQSITTLTMSNGKAYLQDGDITIGTLNGANENRYFVTFGAGRLIQPVTSVAKSFPIGPTTGSYNPIILQQVSGTASFGARVKIGFDYPTGSGSVVNRQWQIDNTSGTPNTNVTLQWNPADEIGGFNSSDCHISRWSGSGWESYGNGAASCGSTCARTQMGVMLFSPFGVGSGLALPVELVDFQVVELEENALLTWHTATELNNQGFDLEKSTDGLRFESIAFVEGAGTTTNAHAYQFLDEFFDASSYYRLRQVDFDGQASFSKVVFLAKEKTAALSAYPNPAADVLNIPYQFSSSGNLSLTLYDVTGRAVFYNTTRDVQSGISSIDIASLVPGIYFLKVTHLNLHWLERIVLQRK